MSLVLAGQLKGAGQVYSLTRKSNLSNLEWAGFRSLKRSYKRYI